MNNRKEKSSTSRVAELIYIPVAITLVGGVIILAIEFGIFQPLFDKPPAAAPEPSSTIICSFVGDGIEVTIEDFNCYSSDFELEEAVLQDMFKEGPYFNLEGNPVPLPVLLSDVQDVRSLNNLISQDDDRPATSGSPTASSAYAQGAVPEFDRPYDDAGSKAPKGSDSSESVQTARLNSYSTHPSNVSLSSKLVAKTVKSPGPSTTSEPPVDWRFPAVETPSGVPSTPTSNPFISGPPVSVSDRQPLLAFLLFPIYFLGKRIARVRFYRF